MILIGTSAWSIPKNQSSRFPQTGSHLERYSQILNAVEINSSFYKFHKSTIFKRWSELTPDNFSFSVKLNKLFTHESDLKPNLKELRKTLSEIKFLEEKFKVLLLQFPKSALFNGKKMERFYKILRKDFSGIIVIEPRNTSWVGPESIELMREFKITKVNADPERCPGRSCLHGGAAYFRLHGSPDIYRSSYSDEFLSSLAKKIKLSKKDQWIIFDNSMLGHATVNALSLIRKLS